MPALEHEIWIDAPTDKVYELVSEPEGVSRWWDEQKQRKDDDGSLIWEHSPPPAPDDIVVSVRVLERIKNRRMLWECISAAEDGSAAEDWAGTRILFELLDRADCAHANVGWMKEIPGQTVLLFKHYGWRETAPFMAFCNTSWGIILNNLKSLAEKGGN